jgi:hypothetical protein
MDVRTDQLLRLFSDEGKIALLDSKELNLIRRTDYELVIVVIHKAKCVKSGRPNRFRSVTTQGFA